MATPDDVAADGALYWGAKWLTWGIYRLVWRPIAAAGDAVTDAGLTVLAGDTLFSDGSPQDGTGVSSVGITITAGDMITS